MFDSLYFGVCPDHLKRDDVQIQNVHRHTRSFDCVITTPTGAIVRTAVHGVNRGAGTEYVVVRLGGPRTWCYLADDGWVEGIAESDPRHSLAFAVTRAEATFDCPWKAVHAAASAVVSNAPTHQFRGPVRIKDEWGDQIPYGKKL